MELSIIQNKIYEVRGVKVMLDFDIAEVYQVETRAFNQQVKRNINLLVIKHDVFFISRDLIDA